MSQVVGLQNSLVENHPGSQVVSLVRRLLRSLVNNLLANLAENLVDSRAGSQVRILHISLQASHLASRV